MRPLNRDYHYTVPAILQLPKIKQTLVLALYSVITSSLASRAHEIEVKCLTRIKQWDLTLSHIN